MENAEQVKETIRAKLVKKTKELDEAGFEQAVSLFDTHFQEREVETAFCWFDSSKSPNDCPPTFKGKFADDFSPAAPIFPGNQSITPPSFSNVPENQTASGNTPPVLVGPLLRGDLGGVKVPSMPTAPEGLVSGGVDSCPASRQTPMESQPAPKPAVEAPWYTTGFFKIFSTFKF